MLLLGVLQAQAAGQVAAGSFDLLETQVLASSAASVTFSSLSTYAADYKHLQIRVAARGTEAAVLLGLRLRMGTTAADTGANYSTHNLYGYNGAVYSGANANTSLIFSGSLTGSSAGANIFGSTVIDILDPFETTKYKTSRALGGSSAGTGANAAITLESGNWRNLSAVGTLQVFPSAGSFVSGTRVSLYGIKAGA